MAKTPYNAAVTRTDALPIKVDISKQTIDGGKAMLKRKRYYQ